MKKQIFVALFMFSSIALFAGGGWPKPKGQGYFKLGYWWVLADKHFTDTGLLDPNTTNGIFTTSLYGEYGFTDRLTGVLYFPFFSRSLFYNSVSATTGELIEPGEALNALGDTDLGLQFGLITNKPVVLSASLLFGLPTGNPAGGTDGRLQTGDGEFNQFLKLDASTSFSFGEQVSSYVSVYAGVNNRTNGFSDEFRYGVEWGAGFFENKVYAIARLYGIESFQNGLSTAPPNSTSLFANNTEFLTVSPEIAYQFNEQWGVTASFATALAGRIIFANPSYSFGVFYKLQ